LAKDKCCSFCKEALENDSAMSYPVCRLASNLQDEIKTLTDAMQNYHLAGDPDVN